jgi:hypothetical protein
LVALRQPWLLLLLPVCLALLLLLQLWRWLTCLQWSVLLVY